MHFSLEDWIRIMYLNLTTICEIIKFHLDLFAHTFI